MKEILLIGGGGHCRSVIDVIELEGKFKIAGIVDKKELIGQSVLGYKIIACDDDLKKLREKYEFAFISIGHVYSNIARVKLLQKLKELNFILPTIISPLSYVSKHATLAPGVVVMHHALINAAVSIGENSIVNSKALIEHDCIVEDNVHISTHATLNGGVTVKKSSFVGSGSVAREGVEISGFIKMQEGVV